MALTIFHVESRRIFRGERGPDSSFGHLFGGAAEYAGTNTHGEQPPVHLLFRLNTADHAAEASLPGVQWLPLFCAIRYGACDLGYRVLSNREVKILHQKDQKAWEGFPYEGYPQTLPQAPFVFRELPYKPEDPEEALFYAGVFGYDALTKEQYDELLRYVSQKELPQLWGWKTPEAFLEEGNSWPFVQGRPELDCPDPVCSNHGRTGSLRTLAIFMEEQKEKRKLWGPNCDNLLIFYQMCPACGAIRTGNQST